MKRATLFLAVALLGLSACSRTIPFTLPPGVPVHVSESGIFERDLFAGNETCNKLAVWLAHNRSGWFPCLATNPARGIFVRIGELDLQFVDSTVLARTRDGYHMKDIAPSEYDFLRPCTEN